MASIETHLIELILAMAKFRRCSFVSEALALGNNLIYGTPTETKIVE